MYTENVAILKSLVSVAWADGDFGTSEKEMLDALLVAFDATEEQTQELRAYAEKPRGFDDIPVEDLSSDDLRVLIQHAVLLTFIDGNQDPKEKEFVSKMASFLGLADDEATALIQGAEERAKRNLKLL